MKAAAFEYRRADTLAETLLPELNDKPVAGNQSLGPMMNLRLARPRRLIDIATIPELRKIVESPDHVRFGAATTHAEIEDGETPDPTNGWMRAAAGNIAHRAVRNRGTMGGSLAHADPAADWVIVLTGLEATVIVAGPVGERRIPMEDFINGPYTTDLGDSELLVAIEVPRPGSSARWGYKKFMRQVGEFAKASATVLIDPENDRHRCALGALGGPPVILADPLAIIEGSVSAADIVSAALSGRQLQSFSMHVAALESALASALGQQEDCA
ncbi:MAG: carbon monoxide dehydrogenase [Rhodospirillaceae bacterium]|nr:carbon monoxide dehydrogenase [Rhodospirillaceae bacterium]